MKKETKRKLLFLCTMVFSANYLIWRFFCTIPWPEGMVQAAAGILLAAAEAVTILGMFELMVSKMGTKGSELCPPSLPDTEYPDVDVLIATHNEPARLLYKTVNACTFLEYPDKKKVHIYICDDGNRAEIRKLAESMGVGYLGLSDNRHAKSGNYNHALSKTGSPLVATFDADMIPRRKFLLKTVPYFFIPDKKIGLIQTPQSFYNQDLFQFNLFSEKDIPNEQDFFSREINIMRNASNSAAYTGSNTVISREALQEIGGFPYGTITEDFETSLRMQKAGYITYATSEVLASGLSTTTVESMIAQRRRWARGVIQSIRNTNAVFTTKLSLAGRLSYLNAYLYWWSFFNRMVFIMAPIMFALFDIKLVECGFLELLCFWLPSYLTYNMSVRYLSTNIRNMRWSQVIDTILAPYLIVPVFLESIGIRQQKFRVTEKRKTRGRTTSAAYIVPHGILIVLTLAAIFRYVHGKYGMALVYSSVILFWLFHNMITLVYAAFFMLGRDSKRKYERIRAEEKVRIEIRGDVLYGKSEDVSEEGIAFRMEKMRKIAPGERFRIRVRTEFYETSLSARLVYQKETEGEYLYAAMVEPEEEKSRKNWMQIIHDREHSLPKEIDPWMTVYDEISRNIRMRMKDWKKNQEKGVR